MSPLSVIHQHVKTKMSIICRTGQVFPVTRKATFHTHHPNMKPVKLIRYTDIPRKAYTLYCTHIKHHTCEHKLASSWKCPPTKSQYSLVVIRQAACTPIQQGWPITSQAMCSAVLSRWRLGKPWGFRQIGHFVMSSGHSNGATDAGASQNLQIKTQN